jgi:hypothetical protein
VLAITTVNVITVAMAAKNASVRQVALVPPPDAARSSVASTASAVAAVVAISAPSRTNPADAVRTATGVFASPRRCQGQLAEFGSTRYE